MIINDTWRIMRISIGWNVNRIFKYLLILQVVVIHDLMSLWSYMMIGSIKSTGTNQRNTDISVGVNVRNSLNGYRIEEGDCNG